MEIVLATGEHLSEIIHVNMFLDYGNPDNYILDSINDKRVLVVIEDDMVIGFALYELVWGNTPLLALIKIHPEYQGCGVGTMLIHQVGELIKKEGFNFYCSSTTENNTLSRKFHLKFNFVETGILDLPHGREVFYRKDLP